MIKGQMEAPLNRSRQDLAFVQQQITDDGLALLPDPKEGIDFVGVGLTGSRNHPFHFLGLAPFWEPGGGPA